MHKFAALSLLCVLHGQTELHPALAPGQKELEKAWRAGYARAKTDKTLFRAHKFAKRGIGKINGDTVSWVLFWHPRLRAFEQGFSARKEDAQFESQENSQRGLRVLAEEGKRTLRFFCDLGIYPRLNEGITREARVEDLQGVSATLQVGGRLYEPLEQPGDVDPTDNIGVYKWTEQRAVGSHTVQDKDGKTHEETDYIYIPHQLNYRYYTSRFSLDFELYDPDGKPRITSGDKEITILVEGRFGKQKATYRLEEWLNAYEK